MLSHAVRGPRPELLPNPVPLLYVSPPEDDFTPPTFFLERARRGAWHPSRRVPSPSLLHTGWARRRPSAPTTLIAPLRKRDPYAPYIPDTVPSMGSVLAAVLLPWLGAVLSFLRADGPLLPSSAEKRRRRRAGPSPLALLVLLFGGSLVLSAALHACTYAAEADGFELVDPLLVREPALDAGLNPPKMGWATNAHAHAHAVAAAAVASPRERAVPLEVHIWDLL